MNVRTSANQDGRVDHLVIHFTSENYADSLRLLTEPSDAPVSAHYLIPDPRDTSWGSQRVVVQRLVPEARRAWHAGRSAWAGVTNLNNRSIGIEIVNESRCETPAGMNAVRRPDERVCRFESYDPSQIEAVIWLLKAVLERHPDIDAVNIVAHADIASARRVDPGPLFPWQALHKAGIGAWPEDDRVAAFHARLDGDWLSYRDDIRLFQRALAAYGYAVPLSGELDAPTRFALIAFQMHFRPGNYSGEPDTETLARLLALLERYRPGAFRALLNTLA